MNDKKKLDLEFFVGWVFWVLIMILLVLNFMVKCAPQSKAIEGETRPRGAQSVGGPLFFTQRRAAPGSPLIKDYYVKGTINTMTYNDGILTVNLFTGEAISDVSSFNLSVLPQTCIDNQVLGRVSGNWACHSPQATINVHLDVRHEMHDSSFSTGAVEIVGSTRYLWATSGTDVVNRIFIDSPVNTSGAFTFYSGTRLDANFIIEADGTRPRVVASSTTITGTIPANPAAVLLYDDKYLIYPTRNTNNSLSGVYDLSENSYRGDIVGSNLYYSSDYGGDRQKLIRLPHLDYGNKVALTRLVTSNSDIGLAISYHYYDTQTQTMTRTTELDTPFRTTSFFGSNYSFINFVGLSNGNILGIRNCTVDTNDNCFHTLYKVDIQYNGDNTDAQRLNRNYYLDYEAGTNLITYGINGQEASSARNLARNVIGNVENTRNMVTLSDGRTAIMIAPEYDTTTNSLGTRHKLFWFRFTDSSPGYQFGHIDLPSIFDTVPNSQVIQPLELGDGRLMLINRGVVGSLTLNREPVDLVIPSRKWNFQEIRYRNSSPLTLANHDRIERLLLLTDDLDVTSEGDYSVDTNGRIVALTTKPSETGIENLTYTTTHTYNETNRGDLLRRHVVIRIPTSDLNLESRIRLKQQDDDEGAPAITYSQNMFERIAVVGSNSYFYIELDPFTNSTLSVERGTIRTSSGAAGLVIYNSPLNITTDSGTSNITFTDVNSTGNTISISNFASHKGAYMHWTFQSTNYKQDLTMSLDTLNALALTSNGAVAQSARRLVVPVADGTSAIGFGAFQLQKVSQTELIVFATDAEIFSGTLKITVYFP